ncbi:uncharacterized protein MONBRDRAFT_11380 [Monosiga brevicollis MX1]|uniref:Proteasome beta subunit C-terminal domain-containing protein n=1 Tax=Monosiga brevicollis TaxID=81824 RepID=A9V931_MONBE|nr:uncharacterized protein MONBRDRAFT_11380 [Monosiga brevicollis MX1]EDQ85982.1 predicted protein [Monosiga brevicollis MX1]|eukprot:XP_001749176.1 hypothetical protein [Monosiga brevicollis MX1]
MAQELVAPSLPGFTFDNVERNQHLGAAGYALPKFTKTGTTICGVIYKDGVVLGADTRATAVRAFAVAPVRLPTRRASPTWWPRSSSCTVFRLTARYQGHVSAALVLGGVDINGPVLYSIHPHGSTDKLPYVTMGSGSLAAMGVFEAGFRKDMSEEEAKKLVRDAIAAGIFNDLGSGSNVDLCVIKKGEVDYIRPHEIANVKGERLNEYKYPKGSTAVLTELIKPVVVDEVVHPVTASAVAGMETASDL